MSAEPTDASNAPPEGLSENELAVEGHDAPGASKAVVPAAPLTLANFLVHPRFYTQVANYFVFPFLSGVCYAFGECYARVLMGRWGYLPVVVGKKTGKVGFKRARKRRNARIIGLSFCLRGCSGGNFSWERCAGRNGTGPPGSDRCCRCSSDGGDHVPFYAVWDSFWRDLWIQYRETEFGIQQEADQADAETGVAGGMRRRELAEYNSWISCF